MKTLSGLPVVTVCKSSAGMRNKTRGKCNERMNQMKIEAGFMQPMTAAGKGSEPQISRDQSFEALLRNTCKNVAAPRLDGNTLNAAEVREAGRSLDVKPNEEIAVLQAEKVLDMLDVYRENLADESIPLQHIRPLVDEIQDAAVRLDSVIHGVQPDRGAGGIIREISELAHQEVLRYREA